MFAYMKLYVRYVDALNRLVGRCVMYLVFAIMAILLFSSLSRTLFDRPVLWGVEMAQFVTTAYYLLGGGFALLMHSHARMDLFYGRLGARGRAAMDAVTVICLLTFLAFLLYGAGHRADAPAGRFRIFQGHRPGLRCRHRTGHPRAAAG